MEKDLVEQGVAKILGFEGIFITAPIALSHKGNHRWQSERIVTTASNAGIFRKLFSHFDITVDAKPCEGEGHEDFSMFRVNVTWYHNDATGGGNNGTVLSYFYQHSTSKFLTRDEASEVFWANRDRNA